MCNYAHPLLFYGTNNFSTGKLFLRNDFCLIMRIFTFLASFLLKHKSVKVMFYF